MHVVVHLSFSVSLRPGLRPGARRIPNRTRETLHAFVRQHAHDDAKAIYTDDWDAYKAIADHNTKQETVNHGAKEIVRCDVHTNSVESFWSLLERSVIGAFHQVSQKHLNAYLDELEWRFSNRHNSYLFSGHG